LLKNRSDRYHVFMDPERRRRGSEAAASLVYPVISRRSGGLSLGVNLFPSGKACSFDCPYCEVFSSAASAPGPISIPSLEAELYDFLDRALEARGEPALVRDICFSGDGEPTLSPSLGDAIAAADRVRRARPGILGGATLVLITNSTGFLDPLVSSVLERVVDESGLEIWAKLDAGGEELFRLMSGASLPLGRVAEGILSFASRRRVTIQTMLCEVRGYAPSIDDARELGALLASLVSRGARLAGVQAYTFARPTPGGGCSALPDARLVELAREIAARSGLPVLAFGRAGALGEIDGPGAAPAPDAGPGPARGLPW
jgi:wyosine [tRNA(Phe)-imidazoG37] synthetase (radical SAM superfamily)